MNLTSTSHVRPFLQSETSNYDVRVRNIMTNDRMAPPSVYNLRVCVCTIYPTARLMMKKKVGESEFSNVEIYYCYAYNFHLGSELGNASVIGRYSYDVILKLVKSKNAW